MNKRVLVQVHDQNSRPVGTRRLARILLIASFVAFVAAMLVHHRFVLAEMLRDVGLYPAVVGIGLLAWKDRRWLYAATAIGIALPAVAFFELAALTAPGEARRFANHLFLLLAAVFAGAGGAAGFVGKWQR